jgi:4-amino-4-deoxy-L-arabinose transferase-like glycosyltransferase
VLVATPTSIGKRIGQLLAAGAALLVAGGAWIAAVALTPAAERPYIGGSTTNSILEVAWDYNGPGRIFSNDPTLEQLPPGAPADYLGTLPGPGRLFAPDVAGQYAWLLPLAVVGLLAGLWWTRRAPRTDVGRAGFVLWGGWLLLNAVVFSFAEGAWHAYYTVAMLPAIAALAGGGMVLLARARTPWASWVLALGFAASLAWSLVLLRRTPDYSPWLTPLVAVVGGTAVVVLALAAFSPAVAAGWPRPAARRLSWRCSSGRSRTTSRRFGRVAQWG